ncbi:hypothetical protein KAR10_06610 [bacterium]|nr:hypothetical protein [bacterium]
MAKRNDSEIPRRLLVDFAGEEEPRRRMLPWTSDQLMQIENKGWGARI